MYISLRVCARVLLIVQDSAFTLETEPRCPVSSQLSDGKSRRIQWTFNQDEGHVVLVARNSRRVISRSKENGGILRTPENGRSNLVAGERANLSPSLSRSPVFFSLVFDIWNEERSRLRDFFTTPCVIRRRTCV